MTHTTKSVINIHNRFLNLSSTTKKETIAGISSFLSPAAYFMDLMHHVHAFIRYDNVGEREILDLRENSEFGRINDLYLRRPDLWTINLGEVNEDKLISKISILNKVLLNALGSEFNKDNIINARPFISISDIEEILQEHNISIFQLWKKTGFKCDKKHAKGILKEIGLERTQFKDTFPIAKILTTLKSIIPKKDFNLCKDLLLRDLETETRSINIDDVICFSYWYDSISKIRITSTNDDFEDNIDVLSTHDDHTKSVLNKIKGKIRERLRDILLVKAKEQLQKQTNDELYVHLLIDVEVSACLQTSVVKEAISALQLYIYRCINHLEGVTVVKSELVKRWDWLKHYRLWQANREVFLFPENYLRPELRKNITPEFKELISKLHQSDYAADAIEQIVNGFVENTLEVLNLKTVGSYIHQYQDRSDVKGRMLLVGRTVETPHKYYYRFGYIMDEEGKQIKWKPWKQIHVQINCTKAQPVFAFGKFYLFWVETKISHQDRKFIRKSPGVQKADNIEYYDATVHFSFLKKNGQWNTSQQVGENVQLPSNVYNQRIADDPIYNQVHVKHIGSHIYWRYEVNEIARTLGILNQSNTFFVSNDLVHTQVLCNDVPKFMTDKISIIRSFKNYVVCLGAHKLKIFKYEQNQWNLEFSSTDNSFYLNENNHKVKFENGRIFLGAVFAPMLSYIGSWGYTPCAGNPYVNKDGALLNIEENRLKDFGGANGRNAQNLFATNDFYAFSTIHGWSVLYMYIYTDLGDRSYYNYWVYFNKGLPIIDLAMNGNFALIAQNHNGFIGIEMMIMTTDESGANTWKTVESLALEIHSEDTNFANMNYVGNVLMVHVKEGIRVYEFLGEKWREIGLVDIEVSNEINLAFAQTYTSGEPLSSLLSQSNNKPYYHSIPGDFTGWVLRNTSSTSQKLLTSTSDELPLNNQIAFTYNQLLHDQGVSSLLLSTIQKKYKYYLENPSNSPNHLYFEELFLHMPMLIANSLSTHQKYEEAKTWYNYLFNPLIKQGWDSQDKENESDACWQYIGLRTPAIGIKKDNSNGLGISLSAPFDPYVIADIRPEAYKANIFLAYLDNLINWADQLFRAYTRESIVEAEMIYIEAKDLLLEEKSNTTSSIPSSFNVHPEKSEDVVMKLPSDLASSLPANAQLEIRWKKLKTCLYNIRHGLNIDGKREPLPLYEPELDPLLLIQAGADDQFDFDYKQNSSIYNYRFKHIYVEALAASQMVSQLGQSLLQNLEKSDSEELAKIYNINQYEISNLAISTRQKQLQEVEVSLEGLKTGLDSVRQKSQHYDHLIQQGFSSGEISQIALEGASIDLAPAVQAIMTAAIAGHSIPSIFGFSDGGQQVGEAIQQGARIMDTIGNGLSKAAGLAGTISGYQRRAEDWNLQRDLAELETEQVQRQITATELQVKIAADALEQAKKELDQEQKIHQFLFEKHTNKELYNWMLDQLLVLFNTANQLALDLMYLTKETILYELSCSPEEIDKEIFNPNLINTITRDSVRGGLLAGDQLTLKLQQLNKFYLDKNKRKFELTKYFSLKSLTTPRQFKNLIAGKGVQFSFIEKDFDRDFPGHIQRQIKSISLTFPMLLAPYQTVNAVLTQTGNRVLLKTPTSNAKKYNRFVASINKGNNYRKDWAPTTQIAISQGVNDHGLFEVNFNDERYLPFEGTGAISDWTLKINKMNGIDLKSITDVVITLHYTSISGGNPFENKVSELLKEELAAK